MRLRIRKGPNEGVQTDEKEVSPSVVREDIVSAPEEDINDLLDDLELLKGGGGEAKRERRARKEEEEELSYIVEGEASGTKREMEEELSFEEPRARRPQVAESARGRGEGWAISLLRSLDGAPDDMVSTLPLNILQKALEDVAKSQGDVGILARIVLKRLKSCLEGK